MKLALLCQFTAQRVSDVNTSIFRSLRLLGALLCRLYCAVMTEVYVLIYLSCGVLPILCVVCGCEWVCCCKRVVSCGSWTFLCVVSFGDLCICDAVYMHEIYIHELRRLKSGMYSSCILTASQMHKTPKHTTHKMFKNHRTPHACSNTLTHSHTRHII